MPVIRPIALLALAAALGSVLIWQTSSSATSRNDGAAAVGTDATRPAGELVAQAQCFGTIGSCKLISPSQRCHATQKVIYTLQGSQWCKTPVPCTC
jgi:hypothetical protein